MNVLGASLLLLLVNVLVWVSAATGAQPLAEEPGVSGYVLAPDGTPVSGGTVVAQWAMVSTIAHGPQQVNNLPPRARDDNQGPIELLEAHGERVDNEAPRTAGAGDPDLAAVGTRNGSENAGG